MSVRVTTDPAAFQATTFGFLESDPVLHTVILGNVAEVADAYTDLANPPSNKLYAQLGYTPVADFVDPTFRS